MARTRLRGLSIGGIQIGIEVPENLAWEWPDSPIADYPCLPRAPEVHVGVRVGTVPDGELEGERYAVGPWTFEAARRGSDWLLGLSRRGQRVQLAIFDERFREGEVVVTREAAMARAYPLRGALDEWIVLHRTLARGGLCIAGEALPRAGAAIVRLGQGPLAVQGRWRTTSSSLLGRNALLVREDRGRLRVFRTPWSDAVDPTLPNETAVAEFQRIAESEAPWRDTLDPGESADLLATHAIAPLCDEATLDQMLRNARRIAAEATVVELGEVRSVHTPDPASESTGPLPTPLAPPRAAF